MTDNVRDTTDDVRQCRNATRSELYRIHRAAEPPEQNEERRRGNCEFLTCYNIEFKLLELLDN